MARTLSTQTQSDIAQTVTTPRYLIELGFTTVVRLSTRGDVTYMGAGWVDSGAVVDGLNTTPGGGKSLTLQLPNYDNAYTSLVLNFGIRDRSVKVYVLYSNDPFPADEDGELIFEGRMDAVPSFGDVLTLDCQSDGNRTRNSPRTPLVLFLGADMPAPGTVITWNGGSLTLQEQ